MLLALVILVLLPTMAQVGVSVSIGLPPPIEFAAPPNVIVITDVAIVGTRGKVARFNGLKLPQPAIYFA